MTVSLLGSLALLTGTAYADALGSGEEGGQQSDESTSHESDNDGISAGIERITYTTSGGSEESNSPLTSTTEWTPPACYYAPVYTPTEMEAYQEGILSRFHTPPWPPEDVQSIRESHEARFGEDGEFPNYNIDQEGEGLFWMVVRNDDYPLAEQLVCDYRIFWVEFGDPPPDDPNVVDTDTLAELAWEHTRVPETEVSVSPEVDQVVGVPTWVWLDEAAFEPVTVRAELPDYGIWAETTATPATLTLDPGTEDADLHPGDGSCSISADGTIGEPYSEGRGDETPPCGLTYLRATPDAEEYELEATLTWEITWTDYQGNTGSLPDGAFSTTVDLNVEEIQAIVQ
ncbi:hypothetical protein ACTWP5_23550 [Streptomyces sp. 4N509B]|uniref:hypothetical protein n=1 Tax=Streptomyces sp. 4N509B TaxID=3457413 RepID=UPI003FD3D738